MSRAVPIAILEAFLRPEIAPFFAVEMLFDTEPLRIWTGQGDRVIAGYTYLGVRDLLAVAGLEETSDLSARAASLTLNGLSGQIKSIALGEPFQGRLCRVLCGDRSVDDAIELFSGPMNTMDIDDGKEAVNVTITVDSRLVLLEQSSNRRYTHESQQSLYPGDTFFAFVASLQGKQIPFGRLA